MCTVTSPDVLLTNTSAVYHIPCTRSPRSHAFVCLVADKLPQLRACGNRLERHKVLSEFWMCGHRSNSSVPKNSSLAYFSHSVGIFKKCWPALQQSLCRAERRENAADIAHLPGRTSLLTDPLKPTHFIEACMRSSKVWSEGWFVRHRGLCLMVSKHLLASFLAESAKVAGCALQV